MSLSIKRMVLACSMKVVMAITSYLNNRCILPGTVIVSSSEDLSEDSYSLFSSSTGPQKWTERSVPGKRKRRCCGYEGRSVVQSPFTILTGNTIYYKVILDDESNSTMKLSRFSFSVVGIQTGRYVTCVGPSASGHVYMYPTGLIQAILF